MQEVSLGCNFCKFMNSVWAEQRNWHYVKEASEILNHVQICIHGLEITVLLLYYKPNTILYFL
jgi:hypothetical protein